MNLAGRPGLARMIVASADEGAVFDDDVDLGEAVRVMEEGFSSNDRAKAAAAGEIVCQDLDEIHDLLDGLPCPRCRAVV